MKRILVVNGPNLNLLGHREPEIYGTTTLDDLGRLVMGWADELDLTAAMYQSNHEGALIDRIQAARYGGGDELADAIIINPGAYSHYSYAIHDALVAAGLPSVEVHISNIKARESWRHQSVTAAASDYAIYGRGVEGYRWALKRLFWSHRVTAETIAYGDDGGVGDLRVPSSEGPHPVVVLIHGGFWRDVWTRDTLDGLAVDLIDRGWATWNIEYRRVGTGGGWPVTTDDVVAAIDHLRTLADTRLDLDRVVFVGHSAGGHLAMWAAGHTEVRPVRAVGLAPVTDLDEAFAADLGNGAVEDFLRRTPDDGPERYTSAAIDPTATPMVIVHGTNDAAVPLGLSETFSTRTGVPLVRVADADHFDVIEPTHAAWHEAATRITAD